VDHAAQERPCRQHDCPRVQNLSVREHDALHAAGRVRDVKIVKI
jgi:hypothetical protein